MGAIKDLHMDYAENKTYIKVGDTEIVTFFQHHMGGYLASARAFIKDSVDAMYEISLAKKNPDTKEYEIIETSDYPALFTRLEAKRLAGGLLDKIWKGES